MFRNADNKMIKDIPIFYGYGTKDLYVTESKLDEWSKLLKKEVTKNFQLKRYNCLEHGCSNVVRIYFISLCEFYSSKYFKFP